MGTFHVGCKIENHTDRAQAVTVPRALVNTGSEYTWISARTLEKIGRRSGEEGPRFHNGKRPDNHP